MKRVMMVLIVLMFALGATTIVWTGCDDKAKGSTEKDKEKVGNRKVDNIDACYKACEQAWENSDKKKADAAKNQECKSACQ